MKFRTQFDSHERMASESGSPIRIEYESYYDDNGNLELRPCGKVDQYMDIQSHADSVDINIILARYVNGDESALNRAQGFYGDISSAPQSIIDVMNLVMKGEREFNALPIAVKEKFENNFAQFIATAGSDEWKEKMSVSQDPPEVIKEGESE